MQARTNDLKLSISTHLLAYHRFEPVLAAAIAESGFRRVEMWCMRPHFHYENRELVQQTRAAFQSFRILVSSIHLPFYAHLDLLRQGVTLSPISANAQARQESIRESKLALDAGYELGASTAVLHLGEKGDALNSENRKFALQAIAEIGDYAKQRNMTLALENILSELTDIESLNSLIEESGLPNLGICLDVGHSQVWKNPITDLHHAGKRLCNAHLHDNDSKADQHLPPGKGSILWDNLMHAFIQGGYQGSYHFEIRDESRGVMDPKTLLRESALAIGRVAAFQHGENLRW